VKEKINYLETEKFNKSKRIKGKNKTDIERINSNNLYECKGTNVVPPNYLNQLKIL